MIKKILTFVPTFFWSIKFYLKFFALFILGSVISLFLSDYLVKTTTKKQIFTSINNIPYNKVGMVLGTSKYLKSGNKNAYYTYRINATVDLFNAGKIDYVLISGDNSTIYYDEPNTFKDDLIKKGIPENRIILDYAGFRTLDSVVRANKVFGQTKLTIISQKFHIERALYIANHKNIDAVGYVASNVSTNYGFKTLLREKFARVKLMIDLLFNVQPKFLGEPVKIGE